MSKENSNHEAKSQFFLSSVFLSMTIGIPFSIFKYLFGALAIRHGMALEMEWLILFGWFTVIWAGLDLIMNCIRGTIELIIKKTVIEFCLIAQIGRLIKRENLFLALDTFLSFTIICFVLWSGWITDLRGYEKYLWYGATTVNLISLAIVDIWNELRSGSGYR